jgi:protein TonB
MTDNGCYAGPNARFLSSAPRSRETLGSRVGNALSVSLLAHVVGLITILMIASRLPSAQASVANLLDVQHLAWIGSGGGGSGQNAPEAATQLQQPGSDSIAIPAKPRSEPRTLEQAATQQTMIEVPVVATTAGVQELPGVVTAITPVAIEQNDGPGSGGRSGSGRGPGNGSGDGAGFGPGHFSGFGDGYTPGGGVSVPRLVREVKPGYTSDAMRARIQGTVRLQAIVAPDGSVSAARVIRSLDDRFGLDQEAVKTIKQWRFLPGTLAGRPVPVLIEIELTFTLR